MRHLTAIDMFCGAGGESEGLRLACAAAGLDLDLTAINHNQVAIETHSRNHPDARHICETFDSIDPRKIVRPGQLDLLWASPECIHHSNARGGKPVDDQSRSTAWHVIRWADALRPAWIGVENVREFLTWGPLGANMRPLKSKAGTLFRQWVECLRALGYTVEWRILCAADYAAATTRRRLFVLARYDGARARGPIAWPRPTHARPGAKQDDLFADELLPWRAAREVIDWTQRGASIFDRKKPLSPNTLARIAEGFRRQGAAAEPFLMALTHGGRVYGLDRPMPTVTGANRGELALVEPFILGQQSGSVARSVANPLQSMATDCAISLVQPYMVSTAFGERDGQRPRVLDIDKPMPTILPTGTHGLVQPFLVNYYGHGDAYSVDAPIGTMTTRDRFGLVEPGQLAVDILFRMLQPHECAAGQGFPPDYEFAGNRTEVMKQIGNAVEVNQARALNGVFVRDLVQRRAA